MQLEALIKGQSTPAQPVEPTIQATQPELDVQAAQPEPDLPATQYEDVVRALEPEAQHSQFNVSLDSKLSF